MEERRQPAEENVRPSRERVMRLIQRSPALMHVLKQSSTRRLPSRTVPGLSPATSDHVVPISRCDRADPVARCETCLSLSPDRLEVDFGHLSRQEATGVLHHNFDDLKRSAANGCDLCKILFWAVHRTTYSQFMVAARNVERFSSSEKRFYLRLTKAELGYILKPTLVLCAPITSISTESLNDVEAIKWNKVAQTAVSTEPAATETGKFRSSP